MLTVIVVLNLDRAHGSWFVVRGLWFVDLFNVCTSIFVNALYIIVIVNIHFIYWGNN